MNQQAAHTHHSHRLLWLSAIGLALLGLALLTARPADAAYEQVETFSVATGNEPIGGWPEGIQLNGAGGMAVNETGAGGVPAGTLYVSVPGHYTHGPEIVRYNPDRTFSERWTFRGSPHPTERCGPDGEPTQPTCPSRENSGGATDVEVDQSTGDVYVYVQGASPSIHVYTPDGADLITAFGEPGSSLDSISQSPTKLHSSSLSMNQSMAVNDEGVVYLQDEGRNPTQHRIMVFEPVTPGDYTSYQYAGQARDFATGNGEGMFRLTTDSSGHVYAVSGEEEGIAEFDPAQPGAPQICQFAFARKGIRSLTVDPAGGQVFFWTSKDKSHIYALSPCENGHFSEAGTIPFSPSGTDEDFGPLAFDAAHSFSVGRPPGILYGANPRSPVAGHVFAQPGEIPPVAGPETFAHVTSTTAELRAQVNPKTSATRYVFQYETEAEYEGNPPGERFEGALESPAGGAMAGDGNEFVPVNAALTALQPDTAYRFRVVVSSHCSVALPEETCTAEGSADGFRTYPAQIPTLPDNRAYELVSPVEKEGGQVAPAEPLIGSCDVHCKPGSFFTPYPMLSAPDGTSVVFGSSAFNSEQAALAGNQYIARRDPGSGWRVDDLSPTHLEGKFMGYEAFRSGLEAGVFGQETGPALTPQAPAQYQNLYVQPTADPGSLTALLGSSQTFHRPATGFGQFEIHYAGASADFSRVFFSANDALTEGTVNAPPASDGGSTKLNLYEWHEGQLALVNVLPGNLTQAGAAFPPLGAHGISRDGARAFFSDQSGQVYVREQGEATRVISDEGVPDPAEFVVASADGSLVLLANGHLDQVEGAEPTIDLTEGKGGFQGVVGETEDLSHIYYVDTEVLDEAANERGEVAESGKDNLYSWVRGEGTRFVAQLTARDNARPWYERDGEGQDWHTPSDRSAEASPNGRFVAFVSVAPLTGYDNIGPCFVVSSEPPATLGPGPCNEAYIYDSETESLICASCDPSGEPPSGPMFLRRVKSKAVQPHYLSDEGRLLFDTRDSILPTDTNEGVEDVYEWEPNGIGGCASDFAEGGCVSLISAGTGSADSNFLAMDPSGKNVFFTTRDQLKLKDKDELYDLYDARVDGGISSESETARSECQGEACQAPVAAPNDLTPGTSSLQGSGNVTNSKAAEKHHKHKHRKHRHKKHHAKAKHGGAK